MMRLRAALGIAGVALLAAAAPARGQDGEQARTALPDGLRIAGRLGPGGLAIDALEGRLGGAAFRGRGRWGPGFLRLELSGRGLLLVDTPDARIRADADLLLEDWTLRGRLVLTLGLIHEPFPAEVAVRAGPLPGITLREAPGGGAVLPALAFARSLRLDLDVRSDGDLRIDTTRLRAPWDVDGRLAGTGARPVFTGTLRAGPGEFLVPGGARIAVERIRLDLPRDPPARLTAEGAFRNRRARIVVKAEGRPEAPGLALRSDPPRSQQALLARVVSPISARPIWSEDLLRYSLEAMAIYDDLWPEETIELKGVRQARLKLFHDEDLDRPLLTVHLPLLSALSSPKVRTEYLLNRNFSVVSETDFENRQSGDLKFSVTFR